ncbi:Asp23/Gls24 family envelope stress response protein [Actinocatenispora rupis]|uniref:Stress protein n=1 Tax=Actinocatenispora rupis TaxID=519421 RepID=A0A8J3J0C1_9ACTN|nr:Asp23/Gls24 family envelope stress response protein [Actinocatenispora rupis]GID12195.1 stress protein [Actinocatenispora rupis]
MAADAGNEAARAGSTGTGERGQSAPNGPSRPVGSAGTHASLSSEHGQTRIADGVVAKIAGMAAREIPGVYSMGTGLARRMGQIRSLVPGGTDTSSASQGVGVEVGEREAAVDLDVVTWYGQSIVEVSDAVRANVIQRVEGMTGLHVVEVNISVDDIYVEGEESESKESRVQ